jgi:hypothetical protein
VQRYARLDAPQYAAWWFFAFPLALTDAGPLPMFIRGDDVTFGLVHAGEHTQIPPGLAVWHQDFERKDSPPTFFYDTRNIALATVLFDAGATWTVPARRLVGDVVRAVTAFRYVTAERMLQGMEAFLAGPEAWLAVDGDALHQELFAGTVEKMGPLPPAEAAAPVFPPVGLLGRLLAGAVAVVTLGGNLLPAALRNRPPVAVPLNTRPLVAALRRDVLVYRDAREAVGFTCRRDVGRAAALARRLAGVVWRLRRHHARLAQAYRDAYPRMSSLDGWRERLR